MGFDGLLIFLVLLLLFGAKKLPELAKGLGSAVREFSKAKDEIHSEMTRAAAPQPPLIAAPQYTEPHHDGGLVDEHGHPVAHGYVVPPDPVPTTVGPTIIEEKKPDVMASTPVASETKATV